MKNIRKLSFIVIAALILFGGFASSVTKVLAAAGEGTATIAVDDGAQGAGVTVVQSTSHTFTVILTVGVSGMTLGASSPTFTIPTGFTAPTLHAVATAGDVVSDGQWSVIAGGCTVSSAPGSATTTATGQVITVDVTADCAQNNTITLTYKGTSATPMVAIALEVRTADGAPAASLIASSPTITVTAAPTPTPAPTTTPTPTSASGSSSSNSSSSSSSTTGVAGPCIATQITTVPVIIESKRISPTSIFVSWGPYAGINTFNVRYGLANGNWLYSTSVTGFSTTLNALPANQPIWIEVAATNSCAIGTYGPSMLVGGPDLPSTGFAPHKDGNPLIPVGIFAAVSILLVLIQRSRFLSNN